ncbi:protein CLEC16A [Aplysia californica]|uniref:Protein CLEC16A n=1 Tax=Aplysia californica TaxID=6500 RepID=A0ABM0JYA3_APLCA|nr:protein CLEC16A [Aplysia californica]
MSRSPRMFSKPKSWLSGTIWRPKNPHSLEHLKFLYNVLCKNQTVTEQNRGLLVETLRSISEILIWGDQNDSSVFDFFLEKNMLSFFLRYLQQKFGRYICVQLLQTLNILFENISNETSLYYLLSNNHINSIIVHKFDFSDEEVMAYYISFLKTLSLKLNRHTIHFFYNEHTNDFALYTEAIKFFNHSESMVRIAVRTITLNVFKVDDKAMLCYIRDRTAAPYFSNLVWFIGNHILDLDTCVRHDHDHRSRDRLADLVAEHLDHLHYLNDIFLIDIDTLNEVLTDKLINRLLVPLYVYSLTKRKKFSEEPDDRKHVSSVVSLFLLSQVFLIIRYGPLMQQLAEVIFQGDVALSQPSGPGHRDMPKKGIREFRPPRESLEKTLENTRPKRSYDPQDNHRDKGGSSKMSSGQSEEASTSAAAADVLSSPSTEGARSPGSEVCSGDTELSSPTQNSTDEEKLMGRSQLKLTAARVSAMAENPQNTFTLDNRPYLEAVFNALECSENDYAALFALCLLYAMGKSNGISQSLLDSVLMPTERSNCKDNYNLFLVERLIRIIELACQTGNKVRLATLEMSTRLLKQLVNKEDKSYLQDRHLACIENARECCTQLLRNFYKSEEIFLDMFEDEYREMKTRPMNVEYLMQDASILLPPTGTPLTGIDFNKRLPCGEVERARRAIRVFFMVRELSLSLMHEVETQLPLTKEEMCIKMEDVLDLNNSDLIACTVVNRESRRQERRFLVIDPVQLILVEPDSKRLGWGVVKFVGYLQDVEVSGDKDDSRLLHVVVHKPQSSVHAKPIPILSARFVFDDHIRCMAAKQRLIKGRQRARQQKMTTIERLLDIAHNEERGHFTRSGPIPGRSHPVRVDSSKGNSSSSSSSTLVSSSSTNSLSSGSNNTTAVSTLATATTTTSTAAAIGVSGKAARRVTPEQKRLLQAKAAQKSKSKQNQQQQGANGGGAGSRGSTPLRDSPGRELAGVETAMSAIELDEVAFASSMAAQSLNQSSGADSGLSNSSSPTLSLRSQHRSMSGVGRGGDGNNSHVMEIPMEDLSHKSHLRSGSSERTKPSGLAHRSIFRFQRSHSHSPTRSNSSKQQETSASVVAATASKTEVSRRLSAPVMLNSSGKTPVVKVSTATQVGRPHSHSNPMEPIGHRLSASGGVNNVPVRRRCLSGPSPVATLRAADAPAVSLVSQHVDPKSSGATVPIPQLLPPVDALQGTSQSHAGQAQAGDHSSITAVSSGIGARPKQYPLTATGHGGASSRQTPEFKVPQAPTEAGTVTSGSTISVGVGSSSGGGLTAHKLSLHGLQHGGPIVSVREDGRSGGATAASAISPETPSSDSAVSSDASMISVSSMASESSMDVDSDNAGVPGLPSSVLRGAGAVLVASGGPRRDEPVVGGKPDGASASQQLTQLAQMVQEHYPYKASEAKHHHTG